jgi:hypothetical protein
MSPLVIGLVNIKLLPEGETAVDTEYSKKYCASVATRHR